MADNTKTRAMDAIAVARDVHTEAWQKLTKVIARRNFRRQSVDKENNLRALANRRISTYSRRLIELKAASVVSKAPTPAEIAEIRKFVAKVKNLAVADAMRVAGFEVIRKVMSRSSEIASQAG